MAHRESRAILKTCGIETEYGVQREGEGTYAANSFYKNLRTEWMPNALRGGSYDTEGRLRQEASPLQRDAHLFMQDDNWKFKGNICTEQGARMYLDLGPHLEISTPICSDPRMLVTWTHAAHKRIDMLRELHAATGERYAVYRNNVAPDTTLGNWEDGRQRTRRNTYGSHLCITGARFVELDYQIERVIPWRVLCTPIVGAGKVGSDADFDAVDFQISQRAEFTQTTISGESIHNRPEYDTRDNPYADAARFRRVHITNYDSNMLELPLYLKAGLESIILMMIEDEFLDMKFTLYKPLDALHRISWDTSVKSTVWLPHYPSKQKTRSITDCLKEYADLMDGYLDLYHTKNKVLKDTVRRFRKIANKLAKRKFDVSDCFGELDWATKQYLIQEALARKGKTWKDPLAYKLDLQYHEENHKTGLFFTNVRPHPDCVRITTDAEIEAAVFTPPPTRSRWMVETLRRYQDNIASTDIWHKITFKNPAETPVLYFGNPNTPWNPELADRLFRLPFQEFCKTAAEAGIASLKSLSNLDDDDDIQDKTKHTISGCAMCLCPGISHNHALYAPIARGLHKIQHVPLIESEEGDDEVGFRHLTGTSFVQAQKSAKPTPQEPSDIHERSVGHLEPAEEDETP